MTTPGPDPPLPSARGLARAFGLLADEIQDYRRRVHPRLTDPGRPLFTALDGAAEVMGGNALGLARSLAGVPPVFEAEVEPGWTPAAVGAAVAAARDDLEPAARRNLLGGRLDRRAVLPGGWAWDGKQMVWSLSAMLLPWPAEVLDQRAGRIAAVLGADAATAAGLRRVLADLPPRRLVRAFRRLGRDEFHTLAEALVRIEPTVPDAVLLVPTGRYGPAASGGRPIPPSVRPDPTAPGVTGPLSHLLGAAMEVRANNHFRLVWRTAVRPECRGSWRCFQAAQVFDVLYQKWLTLHELADRGQHPHTRRTDRRGTHTNEN
jgi:hypothetical protein